jgi:hypothetical protein
MLIEHAEPERAGRPPGYDAVRATIAAEKEHALAAFRRSSFERRLRERVVERQRPWQAVRSRLALVGALGVVLGVTLLSHSSRRVEGVGLKGVTVERALRNAPFFAGTPALAASAEADPRQVELAWSIERIVAGVQRERVKERDLERLVERALTAGAGGAAVPVRGDPWEGAGAAGLAERLARIRRERSVERFLAAYAKVG